MRGLDVFIVRYFPFFSYIYTANVIHNAYNGEAYFYRDNLFASSFIVAATLFIVSLCNKKYHCVWNRAMYVCIMIYSLLNYIDGKYNIFDTAELQLKTVSALWIISAIITSFLAINHFFYKKTKAIWSYLRTIKRS